jgi:hypothetical protein
MIFIPKFIKTLGQLVFIILMSEGEEVAGGWKRLKNT